MGRKRIQKSRPKKGKPIEIPVPKKGDVLRDFEKIAVPKPKSLETSRQPPGVFRDGSV